VAGSDEREAATEDDPSSLETASASLLPAVHLLLGTDRTVKVYDILLATVFECLEEDAKPLDQLIRLVQRAWPGVQVRRTVMEAGNTMTLLRRIELSRVTASRTPKKECSHTPLAEKFGAFVV